MGKRLVTKIILHNSDSAIAAHDDISVIDEWHKARGFRFTDIDGTVRHVGYNYFITTKGVVQRGRDKEKVGAHCKGQNRNSIGICLHGKDKFTDEQFKSLAKLIRELLLEYPKATIHGHNEFSNKLCPVFDVDDFIEIYMSNIEAIDVKA